MSKNYIYVSEASESQQYVSKNPNFKGCMTIVLNTEGESPKDQVKLKKELLEFVRELCESLQS
ncbi:hypothetical protein A6J77_000725 [Aerococcus viridans]|uniref:Uncharacterized protein n=1 Tax=Aerococcus viridans TaxID=1377 RepID=A0A2J9PKN8_9LACT|nr:hypothetical protein A6J77_000725 [Aerococcus viridans]